MATFHVYVEGARDSSPDGIRALATAISQRYGLPAADLLTRLAAGRFRVKANVDKVTAEAYVRALEEVGARVVIEEAFDRARSDVSIRTQSSSAPPMNLRGSTLPPQNQRSAATAPPQNQRSAATAPPQTQRSAATTPAHSRDGAPGSRDGAPHPRDGAPEPRDGSSDVPDGAPRASSPAPRASSPALGAPRASSPALTAQPRAGASSLPPQTAPARQSSPVLPPANRPSAATPPAGVPAQRSGAASLPPATAPRPSTSPMQSGLAAAFTTRAQSESEFGALSGDAISLAALDGSDDAAPAATAFGPPADSAAPIAIAPSAAAKSAPARSAPAQQPLDLFAPPDAEEAEAKVELAADELEHRARKLSTPPAGGPVTAPPAPASAPSTPSTPAMRRSQPSIQPGTRLASEPAVAARPAMPRGRFAAGVLLSILLGFVPVHVIATMRESSAFAAIDKQVVATQDAAVEDEDAYRALDGYRAAQLEKKKSAKTSIVWQSIAMWAAISAGLAYVYFRRIPWPATKPDAP